MKNKRRLIWLVLILLTVSVGCAGTGKRTKAKDEELARTYLNKGLALENKGDLVGAREQYKLALTANPSDKTAKEHRDRLNAELDRRAEGHYREGLRLQKVGKYGEARQHFLTALRLRPDYPEVVEILTERKRVKAKRYIVHTIQPGESLSKLALIYYGDMKKFPIIARYNDMADATQVEVGQKIKVPEIEGMTLQAKKQEIKTEKPSAPEAVVLPEEPTMAGEEGETEEEGYVDKVAMYRDHGIDLFNHKKYEEAITELEKAASANPQDEVTRDYLYQSHFQQAMLFFQRKDYMAAKKGFESSLKYKTDCQKCHSYAKKSEEMYKDTHYKKGIAYFKKEHLEEAIAEWELVRDVDPNYMKVQENIDKAQTLLDRLEQIKKTQKK